MFNCKTVFKCLYLESVQEAEVLGVKSTIHRVVLSSRIILAKLVLSSRICPLFRLVFSSRLVLFNRLVIPPSRFVFSSLVLGGFDDEVLDADEGVDGGLDPDPFTDDEGPGGSPLQLWFLDDVGQPVRGGRARQSSLQAMYTFFKGTIISKFSTPQK